MKQQFVETSNFKRFMAGVAAVSARGSQEACILLLTGEPGTGKTCMTDHYGSDVNAIYLEGVPGMSLTFVRDYLSRETNVYGKGKFEQYHGMVEFFRRSQYPIILDEAQHGLPHRAEVLEYLRRIAENAGVMLILVCHSSEKHRFASRGLEHISTRVSDVVELKRASLDDCASYFKTLCEVTLDGEIVEQVFKQSSGRYRLMANAGKTLETIAKKLGKTNLTATDVKGLRLCEDAMTALKREAK
ncbi:MAG TPA: hypothetical protein DCG63_03925 [Methylophilaceae bacterium]|nr:hypothetical protein [Methylophilaceae bacterium]